MPISKVRILAHDGHARSFSLIDSKTGRPLEPLNGHITGIQFAPIEPGQPIRAVMYIEFVGIDLELDVANIQFVPIKKTGAGTVQ